MHRLTTNFYHAATVNKMRKIFCQQLLTEYN